MTIKLKGKMENFEAKKKAYTDLLSNENATNEQVQNAVDEMFTALQGDLTEKITAEARNSAVDSQILEAYAGSLYFLSDYVLFVV